MQILVFLIITCWHYVGALLEPQMVPKTYNLRGTFLFTIWTHVCLIVAAILLYVWPLFEQL